MPLILKFVRHSLPEFLRRNFERFDFVLLALIILMCACGIVVLGSATRVDLNGHGGLYLKQVMWAGTGFALLLFASMIDYHFICKLAPPIYIFNIILLTLVLFFIGDGTRGVDRWIQIGHGSGAVKIQPSEFSKLFMIISVSAFLAAADEEINRPKCLIPALLGIVVPVGLVYLQPSLSAAAVVFAASAFIVFSSKVSYKNILIIIACVLSLLAVLYVDFNTERRLILTKVMHMQPYQLDRIELLIDPSSDPDKSRQTVMSTYAIGSGQLYGKGMYKSSQGRYTADNQNDFIFTVLGEEFGFVGCTAVLALMFLIILKCLRVASRAVDPLGRFIALGTAAMFFTQSFFHVGVTTGILPNTGVTFPFFSYGGSSMWTCMAAAGMVINVGKARKKGMFID
ncbi:MAG: FtsW/RodA/SpoVE family cell cycle protein [Clostridiales bacterium]|jgi:rod shape determining protein RodA|nr:FtsW/RodA/SpoVE family cell cycle protein [Clostridiales bacterium]